MNELRGRLVNEYEAEGRLGFKGETGLSAYELAVKNGYEGTEQDWIDHFGLDLSGYVQTSDVVDNLTSTETTHPLSAKQGKNLKDSYDALSSSLTTLTNNYEDSVGYSTTEKVVGTWVDGKPLYSKTITFTENHTTDNSTVEVNHAHNLSNVDTIFIDQGHSFAVSGNTSFILGRTYISNSNIAITMAAIVDATNIRTEIFFKGSISLDFTITVNYTKTTD